MKHLKPYTLYERVSSETKLFEEIDKKSLRNLIIKYDDKVIWRCESNKHVMKLPNWAKTFEAAGPLQPSKLSWTKDLTIPNDMQLDIYDMSHELRDEGYTVGYQWWPPYEQNHMLYENNKYPYINITKNKEREEYRLEKIYYGHIKDFCDRVISYLDEMGYDGVVKFRKDNTNDYYEISDSNVNWGPFKDYPMAYSIHFKIEMISRKVYGDVHESNLSQYFEDDVVNKYYRLKRLTIYLRK